MHLRKLAMHKIGIYKSCQTPYCLVKNAASIVRFKSTDKNNGSVTIGTDFPDSETNITRPMYTPDNPATIDNPPTTCCMSGCPNCVFIEWAQALSKQLEAADPDLARKILSNVSDPSMKAFLSMELRNIGVIK